MTPTHSTEKLATPRTDAESREFDRLHCMGGDFDPPAGQYVRRSFARQLERELIKANNELTEADRALNLPGCLVVGYALSDDDKKRYPALAEIERLLAATTPTPDAVKEPRTMKTRIEELREQQAVQNRGLHYLKQAHETECVEQLCSEIDQLRADLAAARAEVERLKQEPLFSQRLVQKLTAERDDLRARLAVASKSFTP